jgi:hypothetical protein
VHRLEQNGSRCTRRAHAAGRDGFARVSFAGTGFTMIRREALLAMIEHYPELRYSRDHNLCNSWEYSGFQTAGADRFLAVRFVVWAACSSKFDFTARARLDTWSGASKRCGAWQKSRVELTGRSGPLRR